MKFRSIALTGLVPLALAACTKTAEPIAPPPPPPPPLGSVPGSTAADRDGDGIIDGYYTSDGIYHPNAQPAPPPPPPPSRRGERG